MKDLHHYVGSDLSISATGDLLPVTGPEKGRQRILRRLVTNPGDYRAHPEYGAGLGCFVGDNLDVPRIRAIVARQILLESAVARDPRPQVVVEPIQDGVSVTVRYRDAPTGQMQSLAFNLNR
ncbi:phage tail protein [Paludibacterium paludis]|uniref:Phage tail protein n=1 Tax=Paludibacterium paludis TaxID=1225769 RepID=A0A918U7F5_9NEIS|nr:phage tail protein [Paludibacterium paludis]GGY07055.1 hypothetical protein GCM10011289_07080 [Paludibacterium paludis]